MGLEFVLGVLDMFLKCDYGDGKMVQWLRVLASLSEDRFRVG